MHHQEVVTIIPCHKGVTSLPTKREKNHTIPRERGDGNNHSLPIKIPYQRGKGAPGVTLIDCQ